MRVGRCRGRCSVFNHPSIGGPRLGRAAETSKARWLLHAIGPVLYVCCRCVSVTARLALFELSLLSTNLVSALSTAFPFSGGGRVRGRCSVCHENPGVLVIFQWAAAARDQYFRQTTRSHPNHRIYRTPLRTSHRLTALSRDARGMPSKSVVFLDVRWSGNLWASTGCQTTKGCETATCLNNNGYSDGFCPPSTGPTGPVTKAEFTLVSMEYGGIA